MHHAGWHKTTVKRPSTDVDRRREILLAAHRRRIGCRWADRRAQQQDDIEIAYDADPFDVTLLVQDALDRYALIPDDSDVAVDTRGKTVTLAGHVRTWAEHDAVIGATWMASGVFEVQDDLYVTG